jgi:hypothetical protein
MTTEMPKTPIPFARLLELIEAEKGCSIAAGSPRFFTDPEPPVAIADVQILQRMIQQYGHERIHELVASLAK